MTSCCFCTPTRWLPDGFADAVTAACAAPDVVGGRFDVHLEPSSPLLWLTGELINRRSRLTRIATGDQAIFIRRAVFEQLGGYADIPLMEDIDLTRRMKRAGRIACLRQRVTTSARRWQKNGVVRTILLMWTLRALYFCGVSPQRLHRVYAACQMTAGAGATGSGRFLSSAVFPFTPHRASRAVSAASAAPRAAA